MNVYIAFQYETLERKQFPQSYIQLHIGGCCDCYRSVVTFYARVIICDDRTIVEPAASGESGFGVCCEAMAAVVPNQGLQRDMTKQA